MKSIPSKFTSINNNKTIEGRRVSMGQHLSRSGEALASTQDHKRKTMFSGYTGLESKIYLTINSLNSCDSRQISNLKIQKSFYRFTL